MTISNRIDLARAILQIKTKFSLMMMALLLCLMTVPLVSAHIGTPVYSAWTTSPPTIDGVISGGEWTDATVVNFAFEMRGTGGAYSETLNAIFYVKNDGSNIYAAVQVLSEDYDALDIGANWDGLALFFEEDNDDVLAVGDNGEGVTTYPLSPFYTYHDLFHFTSWDADANFGGTEDGALAWAHSNATQGAIGDYTFEMSIPLTTVPDGDAYDLAITSLPRKVGFKLWFYDAGTDGVYPDGTNPVNRDEIEDGATFGDLWLAGPPPPVGGMAAPIVIPTNEPTLLTPLIWLASAILFSMALTVVFVKLKKKRL